MSTVKEIESAISQLPRHDLAELRAWFTGFLLETSGEVVDPEAEAAWEAEIRDRIAAVDAGQVSGVAYADVMRAAENRLTL